jgi:hypothetical protein
MPSAVSIWAIRGWARPALRSSAKSSAIIRSQGFPSKILPLCMRWRTLASRVRRKNIRACARLVSIQVSSGARLPARFEADSAVLNSRAKRARHAVFPSDAAVFAPGMPVLLVSASSVLAACVSAGGGFG